MLLNENEFASLQDEHFQNPSIQQEVVVPFYVLKVHYQAWHRYVHMEAQDCAYAWALHKAAAQVLLVKMLVVCSEMP